jgi:hypothetical protein
LSESQTWPSTAHVAVAVAIEDVEDGDDDTVQLGDVVDMDGEAELVDEIELVDEVELVDKGRLVEVEGKFVVVLVLDIIELLWEVFVEGTVSQISRHVCSGWLRIYGARQ